MPYSKERQRVDTKTFFIVRGLVTLADDAIWRAQLTANMLAATYSSTTDKSWRRCSSVHSFRHQAILLPKPPTTDADSVVGGASSSSFSSNVTCHGEAKKAFASWRMARKLLLAFLYSAAAAAVPVLKEE